MNAQTHGVSVGVVKLQEDGEVDVRDDVIGICLSQFKAFEVADA